MKADESSVKVAARIRPQLAKERIDMCQICTNVTPGEPQVCMGKDKFFTFDFVFDIPTSQETIYETCAKPLIDGTFDGYNATILAYGQTGSGKTYTMGTGFEVDCSPTMQGIIPRAVHHLFTEIDHRRQDAQARGEPPPDFKVNAQFMELYNEEVSDLLDTARDPSEKGKKSHIRIHEDASGGIYCVGVSTRPVHSLEETMQCLEAGALGRTTASTNMNAQSSRSHAIFTLHIRQTRLIKEEAPAVDGKETDTSETTNEFETLTAKFHFVDLAGSERLKRTGATGDRAKEGISINCGLLALGNVISALGDVSKKATHVPYRDSKLTRLLQDSLGGNSRTLMIACVSPSDQDFVETLSTLNYANRARNIKNKVTVNQDKTSKQIAALRMEIQALQQELQEYKMGKRVVGEDGVEGINDLFEENSMLQKENGSLRQKIKGLQQSVDKLKAENVELLVDHAAFSVVGSDAESDDVKHLIQGYLEEIETLKVKVIEAEAIADAASRRSVSRTASRTPSNIYNFEEGDEQLLAIARQELETERMLLESRTSGKTATTPDGEDEDSQLEENAEDDTGDEDEEAEDIADSGSEMEEDSENLHADLADLTCQMSIKQKLIEKLEKSQKHIRALRQQYEEKLTVLQAQIRDTEHERDRILANLGSIEHQSHEQVEKVRGEYQRKLQNMQSELSKVQAAKKEHAKLLRNQSHHEKQLQVLQRDLSEMKKIKVKLMNQLKNETIRSREAERQRQKEKQQHQKEQRMLQVQVKKKDEELRQRETVLRRKREELEALKKRDQRPMSAKTAGKIQKPSTQSAARSTSATSTSVPPTNQSRPHRSQRFSARGAKLKWDALEKSVNAIISKKQTVAHMERDMEHWIKDRESKGRKIERLERMHKMSEQHKGDQSRNKCQEKIHALRNDIQFAQDQIQDCQTNIMEVEESKREVENEPSKVISQCHSLEEAKYLLEHFLQMAVEKGILAAQRESETKELTAKLHQENVNNTLQRDMLQFLITNQEGMDIDESLLTPQAADSDSSESEEVEDSDGAIPESRTDHLLGNGTDVGAQPPEPTVEPADTVKDTMLGKKDKQKARRKTATPLELLYAGGDDQPSAPVYKPTIPTQPLVPVTEHSTNEHFLENGDTSSDKAVQNSSPLSSEASLASRDGLDLTTKKIVPNRTSKPKTTVNDNNEQDTSGKTQNNVFSRLTKQTISPNPSSRTPQLQRRQTTDFNQNVSKLCRRLSHDTVSGQDAATNRKIVNIRGKKDMPTTPTPARKSLASAVYTPKTPQMTRKIIQVKQNRSSSIPRNSSPNRSSPLLQLNSQTKETKSSNNSVCNSKADMSQSDSDDGLIVTTSARGVISSSGTRSAKSGVLTHAFTAAGHSKAVLDIYACENFLFSASKDKTAKVWDLTSGEEIRSLGGHPNNVTRVRFCPSTNLVFTSCAYFMKVWDLRAAPVCIKTITSAGQSSDGPLSFDTLVSRQLSMPMGETIVNDIQVNNTGESLYSAAGNTVKIWDLRNFKVVGKLAGGHQSQIMVMALDDTDTADGNICLVTGSKDHYIKVFDLLCDSVGVITPRSTLEPPHYDGIQSLCLQGDLLFSGSRDSCIKKWDLVERRMLHSINNAHKDWIQGLAFMPGGNCLISGCRGGLLKVWHIDNCSLLGEIKAHTSQINAITTNESLVFTASDDRAIHIWQSGPVLDQLDDED